MIGHRRQIYLRRMSFKALSNKNIFLHFSQREHQAQYHYKTTFAERLENEFIFSGVQEPFGASYAHLNKLGLFSLVFLATLPASVTWHILSNSYSSFICERVSEVVQQSLGTSRSLTYFKTSGKKSLLKLTAFDLSASVGTICQEGISIARIRSFKQHIFNQIFS